MRTLLMVALLVTTPAAAEIASFETTTPLNREFHCYWVIDDSGNLEIWLETNGEEGLQSEAEPNEGGDTQFYDGFDAEEAQQDPWTQAAGPVSCVWGARAYSFGHFQAQVRDQLP
ncbi:MAG: hypothetical protein ACPGQL_07625 [Thermoplasmatota archaeon]